VYIEVGGSGNIFVCNPDPDVIVGTKVRVQRSRALRVTIEEQWVVVADSRSSGHQPRGQAFAFLAPFFVRTTIHREFFAVLFGWHDGLLRALKNIYRIIDDIILL